MPSLESLIFSFEQNQLATLLQDIGFCMIFLLILQEHRRDVHLAGIDGGTLLHLTSRNGLPIPVQNRYVYTYVYKEFHNEHISTICFFFWQQSCSLTHNVLPSITVLLLLILVLLAVSCVSPFTFSFFPQIPGSYMGFLLLKGQVFRGELCGEVWQRCCAGCCAGCCPECGYVRLLCRLSRVRSSCGVARSQAAVQSVVARSGKGAVQRAVPAAVAAVRRCLCGEVWQGCCAGCCAGCCPKCSGEGAAQAVRLPKSGKGAVQGAAQAAVHSARPLHCKGFCWARNSIVHCEFLEGSTFKRDRDEISSGRKSICSWFWPDVYLFWKQYFGGSVDSCHNIEIKSDSCCWRHPSQIVSFSSIS